MRWRDINQNQHHVWFLYSLLDLLVRPTSVPCGFRENLLKPKPKQLCDSVDSHLKTALIVMITDFFVFFLKFVLTILLYRNCFGGWPAFVASLLVIAGLTALVEQVIKIKVKK